MSIASFQSRPHIRLRKDQTEKVRQALLPFEGDKDFAPLMSSLIALINRHSASRNRWKFVMISATQNTVVVRHLAEHSSRPLVAVQLWAMCFEHLQSDTGEVLLSRDEMAEMLKEHPSNVSRIMTELVHFGAVTRSRKRIPGLRGPGLVCYYLNPRVATHLAGKERDDAQEKAPLLELMRDGR
jgi:CRP-like cAMP-binding protein